MSGRTCEDSRRVRGGSRYATTDHPKPNRYATTDHPNPNRYATTDTNDSNPDTNDYSDSPSRECAGAGRIAGRGRKAGERRVGPSRAHRPVQRRRRRELELQR